MPSPFPGMDPWLEDADVWRGVHTRLITRSAEVLQPLLRERGYFVDIEERVFIEESERHVYPDLAIIERPSQPSSSHAAVLEVDEPVRVRAFSEPELRERFLQIFASAGRQLVTQVEYISHSNKNLARGRNLYSQKREELRAAGVNLVEIDLLRAGTNVIHLGEAVLQALLPWDYLVNVERDGQEEHEVYPIQLRSRLPRIAVPLSHGSVDVPLDIQAVFEHVYDTGPYPDRIDYTRPPVPPLSSDDDAWANQLLIQKGFRK